VRLGSAELFHVQDYLGLGLAPGVMFPAWRPEMAGEQQSWLVPTFYDPAADRLRTSMHSWVVKTKHHRVLIDACIGNHKPRTIPYFNMRNEPWLERLAACGCAPEDIDFVLCTHLHADHVGWNTQLRDGRWVPTFPNAKYLFGRVEYERWDPRRAGHEPRSINENVFEDSILPVVEAGQMQLVDDGHALDDMLTVEAATGHTSGHAQIRLKSNGHEGIFSGDIIHHPVQVPYPELRSMFDDFPGEAAATREKLLSECAERNLLLLPSHFAEPHYCRIGARKGGAFQLRWISQPS
jgi:glyoxylase-like metal-dependent hydrolase (beta-lactamase superfamily II)